MPPTLPRRRRDASKHDFGRLLIVAGSVGYTGAPTLAARAAVRGGAGLVYLGVPERIYAVTAVKNDEAMPFPLPCGGDGLLSPEAAPELLRRLEKCDALAFGPGLGRSAGVTALVGALLEASRVPTVLDADALWAISREMGLLERAACPLVLTPHAREFERLGGDLSAPRGGGRAALRARTRLRAGAQGAWDGLRLPGRGMLCKPDGQPRHGPRRSGDVLTGLMGALLCQLPFRKAVCAAVYLHGLAGDMCAAELGEYGMTPTDMIERLPQAMRSVTEG